MLPVQLAVVPARPQGQMQLPVVLDLEVEDRTFPVNDMQVHDDTTLARDRGHAVLRVPGHDVQTLPPREEADEEPGHVLVLGHIAEQYVVEERHPPDPLQVLCRHIFVCPVHEHLLSLVSWTHMRLSSILYSFTSIMGRTA